RAPDSAVTNAETADLLDALRRRRGQREPAPTAGEPAERSPSPIALFDALEPGYDEAAPAPLEDQEQPREPAHAGAGVGARRKGRSAMPSWDEIVFGARTDDT